MQLDLPLGQALGGRQKICWGMRQPGINVHSGHHPC